MFRFENSEYLLGLLFIPLALLIFYLVQRWRKKAMSLFADASTLKFLIADQSKLKTILKLSLFCLGLFFLVIGIANPQSGSKQEIIKREGVDLVIALDVSNSMLAEDLSPNRLSNAKLAIARLIDKLQDDRIGLVIFAGQSFVQLPITTDYAAAKLFLDNITTDIIPTQGTAIGSAIDLSVNSFDPKSKNSKAIIVITDGENHEDDAIKAAEAAAEKGIIVHTIGMGSPDGAPIPLYQNGSPIGFRKDNNGTTVITRLDEKNLQDIAMAGKGIFVRANSSRAGLNIVFEQIGRMQKREFGAKVYTDYDDHFQVFLLIGLTFLFIELLISERVSKWWIQLDLFGKYKN